MCSFDSNKKMQTVWIVTKGISAPMKAYSTAQEARAARCPSSWCMTQLTVDEPRKKVTWVLKDELTDTDLMEYSDQEEAMDRLQTERHRFQVVKRESSPGQHSS